MITYTDYLGIDISKLTFDVVNQSGKHVKYDNMPKSFTKFKRSIPANALCIRMYRYLLSSISLLLFITIIGIPFGLQTLKLALVALWPFGITYEVKGKQIGCFSTFMNILWFFIGGIWISLSHIILAIIFYITIIRYSLCKSTCKISRTCINSIW